MELNTYIKNVLSAVKNHTDDLLTDVEFELILDPDDETNTLHVIRSCSDSPKVSMIKFKIKI